VRFLFIYKREDELMYIPFDAGDSHVITFWEIQEQDREKIMSIVWDKITKGYKTITVDINQLTTLTSTGINILNAIKKTIQEKDIVFDLQSPDEFREKIENDPLVIRPTNLQKIEQPELACV